MIAPKNWLLAAAALASYAGAAGAEGLDYTYLQASYENSQIDVGPKVRGDVLALDGSFAATPRVFVLARYENGNFDRSIDRVSYEVGAGYRWSLQAKLDAYADAALVHARVDAGLGHAHDNGLRLDVGLRSRVSPKVELQGGIGHVNVFDSQTSLQLSGRYFLTSTVAVGAGYNLNHNDGGWSVSLRALFGR